MAVAAFLARPPLAKAFVTEVWDYLKQYQLGLDYTSSYDEVEASFSTPKGDAIPKYCNATGSASNKERCRFAMEGGGSNGAGIFLEQAFKRQGTYYFKPDIGFGVHYLNGALADVDRDQAKSDGLPLTELDFSLLAVVVKPYVKLGITPASKLPDIFLSLGPAAEIAFGKVSVNGKSERVAIATSSGDNVLGGYFELEIVPFRFSGEGAVSIFKSSEFASGGNGTKFYPKGVDGMDDFRADFSHGVAGGFHGFGIKMVTPWP